MERIKGAVFDRLAEALDLRGAEAGADEHFPEALLEDPPETTEEERW